MAKAKLNIRTNIVGFADTENSGAPKKKYIDWQHELNGAEFTELRTDRDLLAVSGSGQVQGAYSWSRVAPYVGQYRISKHPSRPDEYVIQYRGGSADFNDALYVFGSAQAFINNLTMTPQNDGTVKLSADVSQMSQRPGDVIYLLGINESIVPPDGGGAEFFGLWSDMNAGSWVVVGVENSRRTLVLRRMIDTDPSGAAETVVVNQNVAGWDFLVQQTSTVDSPRFEFAFIAMNARTILPIVEYRAGAITVKSSDPLIEDTTAGEIWYIASPASYVRIESDQPLMLTFSDPVSQTRAIIMPDASGIGWMEFRGVSSVIDYENIGRGPAIVNVIYGFSNSMGY